MSGFTAKPLNESTWPDFARLVEKHNGVWGGCRCMAFHWDTVPPDRSVEKNRADKECRVREGRAHAALVYDGTNAVAWCQFGPPAELPRIKHKRECEAGLSELPDWRITCFFVDRDYRRKGVARTALDFALAEIARLGGGVVESYPEDAEGRSVSSSFIYNAAASLFQHAGFRRCRRLGKNHWAVRRFVEGSPITA